MARRILTCMWSFGLKAFLVHAAVDAFIPQEDVTVGYKGLENNF